MPRSTSSRTSTLRSSLRPRIAAAAVGALAITGLALSPAPALADATGVGILSQGDVVATTRYDGYDELVRLAAAMADPADAVTFAVNPDPEAAADSAGWVVLPGAVSTGRYATLDWDGVAGETSYQDATFSLRVVETGAAPSTAVRNGVSLANQQSIGLGDTEAGYFVQPYADSERTGTLTIVHGRTDFAPTLAGVSWWDPAQQDYAGEVLASNYPYLDKSGETNDIYGAFDTVLDLAGFDAHDGAVVAVRAASSRFGQTGPAVRQPAARAWRASDEADAAARAERATDGRTASRDALTVHGVDHVQAITLHPQVLATVAAEDAGVREDGTHEVVVAVLDADGAPVAGAEVRRSSDGELIGYTDAYGTVTTAQEADTTERYYANSTDADAYESGLDPITGPFVAYVPEAVSTATVLADGEAFDVDEYSDGDIGVQVLDQKGNPYVGAADVDVQLVAPGGSVDPDGFETVATDDGFAALPFDPSDAQGTWTVASRLGPDGDVAEDTFLDGQATLVMTPASAAVTGSGTQVERTATLAIGSTPLPGRVVDLDYTRAGAADDAGILDGGVLASHVVRLTGADGAVQVTVKDPAVAGAPGEAGRLDVATGETEATASSTLAGDADAATHLDVRFTAGPAATPTATPTTTPTTTPAPHHAGRRAGHLWLFGRGSSAAGDDLLQLRSWKRSTGAKVRIYRMLDGRRELVRTVTLGKQGDQGVLSVEDLNGDAATTYRARLVGTAKVRGVWTRWVRVR